LQLCGDGGWRFGAEKGPTWGITKKVFFDPAKNADFLQFFKIG
jgi:hypothetical protein